MHEWIIQSKLSDFNALAVYFENLETKIVKQYGCIILKKKQIF